MLLTKQTNQKLAVIITCHNYEKYLREAILSVISQSRRPDELVVVNDRSDQKECKRILSEFEEVTMIATDFGNPLLARKCGFESTLSDYICFLDADDRLGEHYLFNGLLALEEHDIAYSDIQYFGLSDDKLRFPEHISNSRIMLGNFLHVGCMTKRNAIDASKAFDHPPLTDYHEDWYFWRKILNMGFTTCKQKSVYIARKHDNNRSIALNELDYYQTRGSSFDTITFCGRGVIRDRPFVMQQNWPISLIHQNWHNTSFPGYRYNYTVKYIKNQPEMIRHAIYTSDCDNIFFYSESDSYPPTICEDLLRKMDGTNPIIHDMNYDFLDCTIISTKPARESIITSIEDLKKLGITYV